MRFCDDHWERLRKAIEDRGLGDLISHSAEVTAKRIAQEFESERSLATFDPLMGAHWAIANNVMSIIGGIGHSPLYLMGGEDEDEDPVELPGGEGRTWPRCPLCYLGLAHQLTCRGERCSLPKVDGYAWMIDRAADEQVEIWEELKAGEVGGT